MLTALLIVVFCVLCMVLTSTLRKALTLTNSITMFLSVNSDLEWAGEGKMTRMGNAYIKQMKSV